MKKTVTLILALCLLLTGFSACGGRDEAGPLFAERGEVSREPMGELQPAADAAAILANLSEAAERAESAREDPAAEAETGLAAALIRSLEPDADGPVRTDGTDIYMVDSYGLIILSAAGADSELLSYTRIRREGESWGERLYLGPDRAAVLYAVSGTEAEGEEPQDADAVCVVVLDVSDRRAPKQLSEIRVEGSLAGACLIDGTLCLVTRRSYWELPPAEEAERLLPVLTENGERLCLAPGEVYLSPEPGRSALTLTAAIRLEDGRLADALAMTDGVEAVCRSGNSLFLGRSYWTETASAPTREEPYTVVERSASARTEIARLRLEGGLRSDVGCILNGALPDASALSAAGDGLRVLTLTDSRSYASYTDEKHGWTNYEERSCSRGAQLALLNEDLELSGALTGLGGEKPVRGVRFTDSAAFLLTGREEDPVYLADLSDPADPSAGGSLPAGEQPAWLLPWGGDLVLSIGDPAAEDGWRLAMLDLSDPAAPKVLDSIRLKDTAPASEPADRGLLLADEAAGLIGLPVRHDGQTEDLLIRWTGRELNKKGVLAEEAVPEDARGLLVKGLLYLCSPGAVVVADPDTMEVLTTVSNAVG